MIEGNKSYTDVLRLDPELMGANRNVNQQIPVSKLYPLGIAGRSGSEYHIRYAVNGWKNNSIKAYVEFTALLKRCEQYVVFPVNGKICDNQLRCNLFCKRQNCLLGRFFVNRYSYRITKVSSENTRYKPRGIFSLNYYFI